MAQKQNISTHVLDTARGLPAGGIQLKIHRATNEIPLNSEFSWEREPVAEGTTNADGRALCFFDILPGVYKATFYVAPYFERMGTPSFYPRVDIIFRVSDPAVHHHVPLLLSPYGYSTYKGS
ncbi:transthyretin [Ochromonadaceae sp. CCMP2298]|nr:transthyretin [Ochromonadaceae sp. CCMP2298]